MAKDSKKSVETVDTPKKDSGVVEVQDVLKALPKEQKHATAFYKNGKGIFKLVKGKLTDEKGKATSAKEVSSKKDPLQLCDEDGKLIKKQRGVLSAKPVKVADKKSSSK